MSRTFVAASIALVLAASLSGCLTINLPPEGPETIRSSNTAFPTPQNNDDDDETEDVLCIEEDVVLNMPDVDYVVTGDCDSVTIEGEGVDATIVATKSLVVRGNDNDVQALELGSILVNGQGNSVEVTVTSQITKIEIAGNDNDIETLGSIIDIVFNGSDNEVDYIGNVDKLADNGSNNRVGPRT